MPLLKSTSHQYNREVAFCRDLPQIQALAASMLASPPLLQEASLAHIVEEMHGKSEALHLLATRHQTPFYCFDEGNLKSAVDSYLNAFTTAVPQCEHFYAVKLNHHPRILGYVRERGFHADVSSGRELSMALDAKFSRILFSGPGKGESELILALSNPDVVTVNVDSFGELRKISSLAKQFRLPVSCGVRISCNSHNAWDKFGIPLSRLKEFLHEASAHHITVIGIQFHISWNENSLPYESAIQELSHYLEESLSPHERAPIRFIDFGGGFRPYRSEGYYTEDTPHGAIVQAVCDEHNLEPQFESPYQILPAVPIEEYARGIGDAIDTFLRPIGDFDYYSEPGRVICNSAFHVLLRVADVKGDQCIITDGGTNIVGFERFEFDYFPVVNLTHPSLSERDCMVYGSLCMPQDYWGRRIYSGPIREGDLLVVPYQGALTFSNMQDFIKGRVLVHALPAREGER